MADDTRLKSSFELAMERLRQKDADSGVTTRTLTDAEKAQIAEVRNSTKRGSPKRRSCTSRACRRCPIRPAARRSKNEFRVERERLTRERDRKVEKIQGV